MTEQEKAVIEAAKAWGENTWYVTTGKLCRALDALSAAEQQPHEPGESDRLRAENARMKSALTEIACYEKGQVVNGSFDCPACATIARNALESPR